MARKAGKSDSTCRSSCSRRVFRRVATGGLAVSDVGAVVLDEGREGFHGSDEGQDLRGLGCFADEGVESDVDGELLLLVGGDEEGVHVPVLGLGGGVDCGRVLLTEGIDRLVPPRKVLVDGYAAHVSLAHSMILVQRCAMEKFEARYLY